MGWFRIQLNTQKEIPGAFSILFNIFIIALFFDAAATSIFMIFYGPEFEIHPVYLAASIAFGPIHGPMLGALFKAAGGLIIAGFNRRFCCYILLVTILISLIAGVINISACPIIISPFIQAFLF